MDVDMEVLVCNFIIYYLRLCLVTFFIYYFQKLVSGNIKKKQFSYIFEIKNIFGYLKLKKIIFEEKNRKY